MKDITGMGRKRLRNIGRWILLFAVISVFSLTAIPQTTQSARIENIMAVYIYNFTKFLDWPDSNSTDFNIGVWKDKNLLEPLNSIADKKEIKGKKVVIREIEDYKSLSSCNVLFVSTSNENVLRTLMDYTKGKSILLITNSEGFAQKGAAINFLRTGDKIKFEINKRSLEENGIVPSSRLLSIAEKVYEN